MFRSRRSTLGRRLLRSRVGCAHGNDSGSSADRESEAEADLKAAANSLLTKRLKEKQLELLLEAVESRGGTQTSCVPISKGELKLGRSGRTVAPHVLCCQLFRWPDLKHGSELKRLKFCCESSRQNDEETSGTVCCNPYHISRLCRPESPPPPYSRIALERSKTQETQEETMVPSNVDYGQSTETGNTPTERRQPYANSSGVDGSRRHWCHVAYWEQRTRVGPMYSVFTDSVNIFYDLPHGDGFCLGLLKREGRPESVARTQPKIGYGLTMSREDDGVWIYNRSNYALFVNSPALDIPHSRTFTVHKLAPGFSIKIYDHAKSKLLELLHRESEPPDGPVDPNSIRISFIKGWGPHYARQFIMSCPCWIEVIVTAPPR